MLLMFFVLLPAVLASNGDISGAFQVCFFDFQTSRFLFCFYRWAPIKNYRNM